MAMSSSKDSTAKSVKVTLVKSVHGQLAAPPRHGAGARVCVACTRR